MAQDPILPTTQGAITEKEGKPSTIFYKWLEWADKLLRALAASTEATAAAIAALPTVTPTRVTGSDSVNVYGSPESGYTLRLPPGILAPPVTAAVNYSWGNDEPGEPWPSVSTAVAAGAGGAWGSITGTLSAQTDLQTALDAKYDKTGGTVSGAFTNAYAGTVMVYLQSTDNGAVQLRFKTNSTNRRFIALDSADVTKAQIIFNDTNVTFCGATTPANDYFVASSAGLAVPGVVDATGVDVNRSGVATQWVGHSCDSTANKIISYSTTTAAKELYHDSTTDVSNTTPTGGAVGHRFKVLGVDQLVLTGTAATFTNRPTFPTATPGTDNTEGATTAFVNAAVVAGAPAITQYSLPGIFQMDMGRGGSGFYAVFPGNTTGTTFGLNAAVGTSVGTATGHVPDNTNVFTRQNYMRLASAAAAGSSAGQSVGGLLSNGQGGFRWCWRFGTDDVATVANARCFYGLRDSTAQITNVQPSSLFNIIGFGCDAGETTLHVMHNDASGTATKVNLGANFPTQTLATDYYEGWLQQLPGASTVEYYVRRVNTADFATGTLSTNLPALATYIGSCMWRNNGATALAVRFAMGGISMRWTLE